MNAPESGESADIVTRCLALGVRYKLPVLSIGIDVAQALSRSGAGPRIRLNITPNLK